MNSATDIPAELATEVLPDLGETAIGLRDYPDRAAVIRGSYRVLVSGLLSPLFPPLSWAFCVSAHRDVHAVGQRALDPIRLLRNWPRQAVMGCAAGGITAVYGVFFGVPVVLVFSAIEARIWLKRYRESRSERWNPIRHLLYLGLALSSVARIHALAFGSALMSFIFAAVNRG